jgi:putative ABC transport system permease protein
MFALEVPALRRYCERTMRRFATEIRYAWRSLLRRPAYFIACAGTLALVLGANAATFAVVSATVLRPLPFAAGDRVVQLFMLPPGMSEPHQRNPLQKMDVLRFRERARTMTRIEGFLRADRVVAGSNEPLLVKAAYVTAGLFPMMNVEPVVGRRFTPEEEQPGHHTAIVSDGYWRRVLGGGDILGRPLIIDGVPHTIVGITPEGFPPVFLDADVFTPMMLDPTPAGRNPLRSVVTVAELAEGATVAQAGAEADRIVRETGVELPRTHDGWTAGAQTFRDWQYRTVRSPMLMLFAATAMVLLIACANIAALTSAQAAGRRGEIAVRVSLGASAGDVLRLQLAELLIVGVTGAIAGLVCAQIALPALLAIDPAAVRSIGAVEIDWRVQAFTFVIAVGTALAASMLPARRMIRGLAGPALQQTGRRGGGAASRRLGRVLVGAEVAMCLALLMAGAVLLGGLRAAAMVSPGFSADGILTAQIRVPPDRYTTTEARGALVQRILENIRAIPGVVQASTTMNDFVPGNSYQTMIHVEGRPRPDGEPHSVLFRRVSPAYFDVLQIPMLRGRAFSDADRAGAPDVAVISERLADQLFPGEDPIGRVVKRTAADAPRTTIIGVVGDVHDVSLTQVPEPTLYLAWQQNSTAAVPVSFVIRTAVEPVSIVSAMREAVFAVDRDLPLRRVQPLETFLEESVAPERFRTIVLSVIAGLGLALAALGIAGVAYRTVADRAHEFSLRLALGALPSRVLALVITESLRSVIAGAVIGAGLGWVFCVSLARWITNVEPISVVTVSMAAVLLAAVAVAAAVLPATRVLRVRPADVLKA